MTQPGTSGGSQPAHADAIERFHALLWTTCELDASDLQSLAAAPRTRQRAAAP